VEKFIVKNYIRKICVMMIFDDQFLRNQWSDFYDFGLVETISSRRIWI